MDSPFRDRRLDSESMNINFWLFEFLMSLSTILISVVNMDAWFGHLICWTGILKTMLQFSFFFMSLSSFYNSSYQVYVKVFGQGKSYCFFQVKMIGWLVGWLYKWQINKYGSLMTKQLVDFVQWHNIQGHSMPKSKCFVHNFILSG